MTDHRVIVLVRDKYIYIYYMFVYFTCYDVYNLILCIILGPGAVVLLGSKRTLAVCRRLFESRVSFPGGRLSKPVHLPDNNTGDDAGERNGRSRERLKRSFTLFLFSFQRGSLLYGPNMVTGSSSVVDYSGG